MANVTSKITSKVSDTRVLALVDAFLQPPIFEGLAQWTVDEGTPQGAVISPLLANLYLDPLDQAMAAAGFAMVRYADDFVVLCRTAEDAQQALAIVQRWTATAGLRLHPEKTHLVDLQAPGGFDFLGYHFERRHRWPRKKSLMKLNAAVRQKTRRTHGHSLAVIIDDLNRILRGWFEYFNHSRRHVFVPIDGWVRMRLRCLLRHRLGTRPGRSIGPSTMASSLLYSAGAVFLGTGPCGCPSVLGEVTPQLESRMRETRLSGSERGERTQSFLPTPIVVAWLDSA